MRLKPKSRVCQKSKIRYLKSKTEVQSPKSEVWCPKSFWNLPEVCLKSEVVYVKSEIQNSKSEVTSKFVRSLKSKVCLKTVRILSKVWIPKSVWYPKYYAQSLSEVWSLKTEFSSLKLPPQLKWLKKGISKEINQSVILIKNNPTQLLSIQIGQQFFLKWPPKTHKT